MRLINKYLFNSMFIFYKGFKEENRYKLKLRGIIIVQIITINSLCFNKLV